MPYPYDVGFTEPTYLSRLVYLNPFFDYSSIFQPTIWHNALRWCHPPKAKILCEDGAWIAIEDVTIGTKVWTHDGVGSVTNKVKIEYSGQLVSIVLFDGTKVLTTPDHVVFISRDDKVLEVPAEEVRANDYVLLPKLTPSDIKKLCPGIVPILDVLLFNLAQSTTVLDECYAFISKEKLDKLAKKDVSLDTVVFALCSCDIPAVSYGKGICLSLSKSDQLFGNGFVHKKVAFTDHVDYSGPVYSITVDPQHTYICDGALVKNCEYIVLTNGILRSAVDRIISFFITDIEIEGTNEKERTKYRECLYDHLNIVSILRALGFEYITYGNFFVSVLLSPDRIISCPKCDYSANVHTAIKAFSLSLVDYFFCGTCPQCKYNGKLTVNDYRRRDLENIHVKRWRPYEILIEYDSFSDKTKYIWQIPEYYKTQIHNNEPMVLANVEQEILDALRRGANLEFDDDFIYHGKEETLSGVQMRGWGLSRIFSALRHAWHFQVLNRMNEAVAIDYINPLRVITPAPRGGIEGGDPLALRNMSAFTQSLIGVLELRRRDPTIWHVSPFPLDYKVIGGDGRVLAPRDLMEQSMEILLASLNIPLELYRGTFRLEAAPLALRLFEVSWSHMTSALNRFLDWFANKLHKILEWDRVKIKLSKPSHSEDINKLLARLRLMEMGRISQTTALQSLGIDSREETRRMMEEQISTAEQAVEAEKMIRSMTAGSEKIQEALAAQQMMQGVPGAQPGAPTPMVAGGAGGQALGTTPVGVPSDPVAQMLAMVPTSSMQQLNPAEIDRLATQLAYQLFGQTETVRSSFLRQLKTKNEILWMSTKAKLEDLMNSARRQGVDMARQQYAQMGMQMPGML